MFFQHCIRGKPSTLIAQMHRKKKTQPNIKKSLLDLILYFRFFTLIPPHLSLKSLRFISTEKLKTLLTDERNINNIRYFIMESNFKTIHWFRQDLRIQDNPSFFEAQTNGVSLALYHFEEELPRRIN